MQKLKSPVDGGSTRHKNEVSLRKAEPISNIINNYFNYLEDTLQENDLLDKPCQSGFALSPAVVALKGAKHPYTVNSGTKAQITVLSCCSAGGTPLIVLATKTLNPQLKRSGDIGRVVCPTLFVICSSGSPSAFAHGWPFFSFWSCLYAVANDVIVFCLCLPPNTTHFLQPLDNGPLKRYWRHSTGGKNAATGNEATIQPELQFNSTRADAIGSVAEAMGWGQ